MPPCRRGCRRVGARGAVPVRAPGGRELVGGSEEAVVARVNLPAVVHHEHGRGPRRGWQADAYEGRECGRRPASTHETDGTLGDLMPRSFRVFAALLAVAVSAFGLAACGSSDDGQNAEQLLKDTFGANKPVRAASSRSR